MESDHGRAPPHPRRGSLVLVRIPMLGLVNHLARHSGIRGERPRRGRNDQCHRKNRPEDTFDCMWLKCHGLNSRLYRTDFSGEAGRDV
jgi:hypothetical protein